MIGGLLMIYSGLEMVICGLIETMICGLLEIMPMRSAQSTTAFW